MMDDRVRIVEVSNRGEGQKRSGIIKLSLNDHAN